ncbi:conserved Plasmodium protein, unknown function [Plasmodium gallinaceum]|uniref:Uncharacterized protein n=1 Tax=Plasmodium gallinaceum TaxID=5849 RepID=A0A1J1GWZ1_PLAGA|nr:conserved Plasmodium protein, unknown function [Plasmodium gallinaceum]CRG96956.1 conserved Plasmodium protein, unknown function [Plasmodium gallinaceum]
MLDAKYENLNKYDLKIYQNDIIKKKQKKNYLRNILFFPSLFWFNGNFSYPLPFLKYNEIHGYRVKDYVTCSVHKHSIIIRKILKNEILNINMFNEKKVLSCLFYINIDYILKLLNIHTESYSFLNGNKSLENSDENINYYLFCYNEKNEIYLLDVKKNNSIFSICEKKQITCLNFNFLYINEKNSLYNKLSNDIYEENIKIVDFDNIDEKIVAKNKYCFELMKDKFTDDLYEQNFRILKNIFYVLIYGDNEGNVYFFFPEKKIKIKKKLANERIQFIETNVKEYFKIKNRHDLFQTINNNYYIFIAFNHSIHVLNFYIFETYFIINFVNEKLFCLTTKFNYLWKNYLSFSTKNYVKVFDINEKKLLHNIQINNVIEKNNIHNKSLKDDIINYDENKIKNLNVNNFDEKNIEHNHNNNYDEDKNSNIYIEKYAYGKKEKKIKNNNSLQQVKNMDLKKKEKELNYYTCIYFDLKDNLFISNNKGLINVYNLSKQKVINTFDINCKVIFYLYSFTIKNNEYIYVYDSEKFYYLFLINSNQVIYKIFTIGAWIYHILYFHNNIIFSLGNENLYNLVIDSSKRNFLKSIYYNNINICIYLINHPNLPIIAFINKKYVFGFFFLNDTKNVIIPSVKENQNIVSICWFNRNKNHYLYRNDTTDDFSNNEETSYVYYSIYSENENHEILRNKKKRRKKIINKYTKHNNDFDTYIAVLNENTLYLYNILNKEVKNLNNDLLKSLYNFKGKKYISSTFVNDLCYVFILYEKKLIIFDEFLTFSEYIIKIEEKINKMYLKEDILFLHSNSNVYFIFIKHIIDKFMKTNYYQDKNIDKKDSNENNTLYSHDLYFIRLKLEHNLKIVLFDFYYIDKEIYVAIFSKKKQIFVYKINLINDCVKQIYENKHLEIEAKLLSQFFNFYIFDHINKVGSILCMKFFYNYKKKKIYLTFGGLEQFLFLWNFLKYSIIQIK